MGAYSRWVYLAVTFAFTAWNGRVWQFHSNQRFVSTFCTVERDVSRRDVGTHATTSLQA